MHQHHGPDARLHRRQRLITADTPVAGAPGVTTTTPALAVPAVTTTPAAPVAVTTTPPAVPAVTTTTPAAPVVTTTTTPALVVPTTTTPAAVTTSSTTSSTTTTTTAAAVTTTSRTTTSSSAMETRVSSSSSSTSTTSSSSTTVPQVTRTSVVVVNGQSSTSVGVPSGSSLASSNSNSGSGVSTGAVVGIVAGALLGVVVIAAIIGYLLKKKRSHDDDEPSPFDRDEFRRTSAMLDDDVDVYAQGGSFGGSHHGHGHGDSYGGGHSPQMSEYGMQELGRSNSGAILPGLARGGTLQNPRPPTAIMQHYNHQQSMPSFQPGQVVPSGPAPYSNFAAAPPSAGPAMDLYGGYPISQHQQAQLDRAGGLYAPQHAPQRSPVNDWNQQYQGQGQQGGWMPQQRSVSPMQSQQAHVERAGSNASAYSGRSHEIAQPAMAAQRGSPHNSREGSSDGHGQRLSLVQEQHDEHEGDLSSRSGTPTNANPQQHFFSHGREESLDGGAGGARRGSVSTQLPSYQVMDDREREREAQGPWGGAERQRRLSIRNGGLDEDEDAYGGMWWVLSLVRSASSALTSSLVQISPPTVPTDQPPRPCSPKALLSLPSVLTLSSVRLSAFRPFTFLSLSLGAERSVGFPLHLRSRVASLQPIYTPRHHIPIA